MYKKDVHFRLSRSSLTFNAWLAVERQVTHRAAASDTGGINTKLAKDIELDAVSRQFEPYLTAGCVWRPCCGGCAGPSHGTVPSVVEIAKAAANARLT